MPENPYAGPDAEHAGPTIEPSAPVPKRRWTITLIQVLALCAIIGVAVALLLPATRRARPAAFRAQCKNNLKYIGLALHNYHDVYHTFPPAYTVDANGKPLHSWRTLILPFLDQTELYQKIDLSKPWDDPANAEAFKSPLNAFFCPSAHGPRNHTDYLAVIAPQSCLRPLKSATLGEITDGASNTVVVIEAPADQSVPWMSPHDVSVQTLLELNRKSRLSHQGIMHALLADGAVRALPVDLPVPARRALTTINGNDSTGE